MSPHKIASIISIFLTIPTMVTAFAVMIRWWPSARKLILRPGAGMSAQDWFIRGVWKGFFKDFFDNGYWLIPWTLVLVQSPNAEAWIMAGVYVNCFVRQSLGIIAARCHLMASEVYSQTSNYLWTFERAFWLGLALGVLYLFIVIF